jgi:hypothetical protein
MAQRFLGARLHPQPPGSPTATALAADPKLPFRHSTAGRKARSDTLLIGSTPSTRATVHSGAHHMVVERTAQRCSLPKHDGVPASLAPWQAFHRAVTTWRPSPMERTKSQTA